MSVTKTGSRQSKEGNGGGNNDDSEDILLYLLPFLPFQAVSFREVHPEKNSTSRKVTRNRCSLDAFRPVSSRYCCLEHPCRPTRSQHYSSNIPPHSSRPIVYTALNSTTTISDIFV